MEWFLLTLFTAGVTIITYKGYATPRGWPIGKMYYSDSSILKIIGLLTIAGSFIAAFFFEKWYLVLIGAVVGWLLSGAITAIFRGSTQYVAIGMLIFSFLLLIFN